jgi:DNA-binding response OmpR family regulator
MAKILIVDDDVHATNLLEKFVKIIGHKPTSINDSTAALSKAHAFMPDLILMDLMMPGLNGFELCALFQQEAGFSNIPIIIISAMEDADSKARAFGAGAKDYVTKPFDIDDLKEKIDHLIG